MRYVVFTKFWHENSCGEQGEGPWVRRSTHNTREEAEAAARKLAEWKGTYGTWVEVREVKE